MSETLDRPWHAGVPEPRRGTVLTAGTFDGVHRGHRAVLEAVCERAGTEDRRALLVTFDPHPLRVLRPESAPALLTTPSEKKEILAQIGLDMAVFLRFTPELSRFSPRRFVEEILLRRLHMRALVVGYDHGLGRGRSGDAEALKRIGAELDFPVQVVEAERLDEEPASSTRIREAITRGDLELAERHLGRPYSLEGKVVRGDGRGRSLGFPTANLHVAEPDKLLPLEGIYAVRGFLRQGGMDGVLHLGPRPTIPGSAPSIELHLFDFDGNIYGERVRVDFIARIRDVAHFDSIESMVEAIEGDCRDARALLTARGRRRRG